MSEKPTRPVKVDLFSKENSFKQLQNLSYEAAIIATQLRKAGNNYEDGLANDDPIIQDARRAKKILTGFLKENDQRLRHDGGK